MNDAEKEGYKHGTAADSWVLDGNTSEETARKLLAGIENGDPLVLDELPSTPLSGEWADSLSVCDVLAWYELTPDSSSAEEILAAFEDGFSRGFKTK